MGSAQEKARIDHVVQKLTAIREDDNTRTHRITNRLMKLSNCSVSTAPGIYGEYFNSDEPSLTDDARFIVPSWGLQDKPDLLVAVMFSSSSTSKTNVPHAAQPEEMLQYRRRLEAAQLFKNEKVGQFIENRLTVRYAATVARLSPSARTSKDFDADDASGAAKAPRVTQPLQGDPQTGCL